jgi:hypothetical protein
MMPTIRKSGTKEEAEALQKQMTLLHPEVEYVVKPYTGE